MTTLLCRTAGLPRIPLAILLLTIGLVAGGRLVAALGAPGGASDDGLAPGAGVAAPADPAADGGDAVDPLTPPGATTDGDLERILANIDFWGGRFAADPRDFISGTRLAASEIARARATGDIGAYAAAQRAIDGALTANGSYGPALGYRGVILVALHRFVEARDAARATLADAPDNPAALATLGDATLELGDVATARRAYQSLSVVADSAAARVRRSHLAFITGDTAAAVAASRSALEAAIDEGVTGSGLAWYRYQLGDTLIGTGDRDGAAAAYAAALTDDPGSYLARWGLARIAAADGRLDEAIAHLDAAIAVVPLLDSLARRADLYELRGARGDGKRAQDDRRTVLAIGQLSGAAAGVYDRTLSLFLATTGLDAARALQLATDELRVRKDAYGYDAYAWALLANDRPAEADEAMSMALAFGTHDAKLLYHAGMIAAALDDSARARALLGEALALDDSFDPAGAARARATLEAIR